MKKEQRQTILFVGGIALGYYVIKQILNRLHLAKSEEEKKLEERKKQQLEEQIKKSTKEKAPKYTVQQIQQIADTIYYDLAFSALSDNKKDAYDRLKQITTDADFYQLYKLFGKRQEYWFGIPTGGLQNLSQMVTSNLGRGNVALLNTFYKISKMNAQL